jgi:hypothetical protein
MMTLYEKLLSELRGLRQARDKADARLLLRLVEVERDHLQEILGAGCSSFAQFVHEFVSPQRFEAFKRGLGKVGQLAAVEIGSEATVVAAQLTDGPEKYVHAIRAWIVKNKNNRPSQERAKHVLMQVDPREETPDSVRYQQRMTEEIARLRAENAELRAEVAHLKRRLREAENVGKGKRVGATTAPTARGRRNKG